MRSSYAPEHSASAACFSSAASPGLSQACLFFFFFSFTGQHQKIIKEKKKKNGQAQINPSTRAVKS
jgi:hypothetical protein